MKRQTIAAKGANPGAAPVVLVIDDDASLREALSDLFNSVGLRTQVFGSAAEFLNNTLPDAPSCLVLDIRLPGQSGLDFQTQLTQANIHIPVIIMTGHGDIPMSVRAMKAGAIDFLTKPFRDQDMLDAVTQAIERDGQRPSRRKSTHAICVVVRLTDAARAGGHDAGHHRPDEQTSRCRGRAQRNHRKNSSRSRDEENGRPLIGRPRADGGTSETACDQNRRPKRLYDFIFCFGHISWMWPGGR